MEPDLPLDLLGAGDPAPGPRWFSLLPPVTEARAGADERWRCAPSLWTAVVRAWTAAPTRVDEAA